MLLIFAFIFFANSQKPQLTAPQINCGVTTQTTIQINVCGSPQYGAPSGFSLQWLTEYNFINYGYWDQIICSASFSGNAFQSRYKLTAGQCVDINVGDIVFDNGASASCFDQLVCETRYVFRAFAHGNNVYNRSPFTSNLICQTLPCSPSTPGCTYTQGFWKNHLEAWPVQQIQLGFNFYTKEQLIQILAQPVQGNGLISLAHQLIAAKLNIANQASTTNQVDIAILLADGYISSLLIPPIGSGFIQPELTNQLVQTLTQYNEGIIGPGHC